MLAWMRGTNYMALLTRTALAAAEAGWLPDAWLRWGVRRLCRERLGDLVVPVSESQQTQLVKFVAEMDAAPIALVPERANSQHYEVPALFFNNVLGPQQKYSCCYWEKGVTDLGQAERRTLEITCERARLENGMSILELGCGWGSLTLWLAKQYPESQITAVSNSSSQRDYITAEAIRRKLNNIDVITADINTFMPVSRFDRVMSIEMFEHLRNHRQIFSRIKSWLMPDGLFFMHIFTHHSQPYFFEDRGADDWMSRHFFSGGMMPCHDLPLSFQDDLKMVKRWWWSGIHYQKTAEAWLKNLDNRRTTVTSIFEQTYGESVANVWCQRWRLFFMACAELFGLERGNVWGVSHYLFEKRPD